MRPTLLAGTLSPLPHLWPKHVTWRREIYILLLSGERGAWEALRSQDKGYGYREVKRMGAINAITYKVGSRKPEL